MDAVIGMIYEHLKAQQAHREKASLLVLCGDHGMTEVFFPSPFLFGCCFSQSRLQIGNHGGSSDGEIMSAFVFVSPGTEGSTFGHTNVDRTAPGVVNQIDLVPSLALLFGLPIPRNNRGAVIMDLINDGASQLIF